MTNGTTLLASYPEAGTRLRTEAAMGIPETSKWVSVFCLQCQADERLSLSYRKPGWKQMKRTGGTGHDISSREVSLIPHLTKNPA